MVDSKLLLIKSITLLYRESLTDGLADNSAHEVENVVNLIELPEISVGAVDTERDILAGLKHLAATMASNAISHKYTSVELLQKIRHIVGHDDSLYNSFKEGIESELSEDDNKLFCLNIKHEITDFFKRKKVTEIIQKFAYTLKFNPDTVTDIPNYVADIRNTLEQYEARTAAKDPAIVESFVLTDIEKIKSLFVISKDLDDERGVLRFGWQGLNRMLQGGIRRGSMTMASGLQHNFKTGFNLSTFKHVALYNKPLVFKEGKKPLLLRITLEDPLTLNLPFLYRNIYENKTGELADIKNKPVEEVGKYIVDQLSVNGFEIMMLQVDPSGWSYRSLFDKIIELETMGFEVVGLWIDYLAMIPTVGCYDKGPTGSAMRDLYRRVRNFCSARKIAVMTPHQLSTEAKLLVRGGAEENFVKDIANKGYYDSCRTLDQEVDCELYMHIIKADGRSFLTLQRGKHRLIRQTPQRDLFCVLPFHDIGDIRDDIDGPDTSTKRVAGIRDPQTGEETRAIWDF